MQTRVGKWDGYPWVWFCVRYVPVPLARVAGYLVPHLVMPPSASTTTTTGSTLNPMPQRHPRKCEHDELKTAQNMRGAQGGMWTQQGGGYKVHLQIFIFILCTDYNQQNHDVGQGDVPLLVMSFPFWCGKKWYIPPHSNSDTATSSLSQFRDGEGGLPHRLVKTRHLYLWNPYPWMQVWVSAGMGTGQKFLPRGYPCHSLIMNPHHYLSSTTTATAQPQQNDTTRAGDGSSCPSPTIGAFF